MKDAGFTMEGNHLVEISKDEYRELNFLCAAIEGKEGLPLIWQGDRNLRTDFDFTNTFQVIKAYYLKHLMINQFQNLLDDMKSSLKEGKDV